MQQRNHATENFERVLLKCKSITTIINVNEIQNYTDPYECFARNAELSTNIRDWKALFGKDKTEIRKQWHMERYAIIIEYIFHGWSNTQHD